MKSSSLTAWLLLGSTILPHIGCTGSQGCRSATSSSCVTDCVPAAPVALSYRDGGTAIVPAGPTDDFCWWHLFGDPDLDLLVEQVRCQNYNLQASRWRIKEARHLRDAAAASRAAACLSSGRSSAGGGGRPTDECSAELQRCERVFDYQAALNTLIAETARIYVQIRSLDERMALVAENVKLQQASLDIAEKKFREGRTNRLAVAQAESNLATIQSSLPQLELARRKYLNALCVLVGLPPGDVPSFSDQPGRVPSVDGPLQAGLPEDLICRRDDLKAAAKRYQQAAYSLQQDPGWCLRLINPELADQTVCVKQAITGQALASYRNQVLEAQRQVEDGIAEFLKKSEQLQFELAKANADEQSAQLAMAASNEGSIDLSQALNLQSKMILSRDQVIKTRTEIALALIETYRALGSGWACCTGNLSSDEFPLAQADTDAPTPTDAMARAGNPVPARPAFEGDVEDAASSDAAAVRIAATSGNHR